jgi:hypothetical protein
MESSRHVSLCDGFRFSTIYIPSDLRGISVLVDTCVRDMILVGILDSEEVSQQIMLASFPASILIQDGDTSTVRME